MKHFDKKETDWNRRKLDFVFGEINTWSRDPSTKVSAALFDDKFQICSAYNGFPPGVEDSDERLNNRELKYKFIQHAESNLISVCARLGIKTLGMTVAVTHHPCSQCAGKLAVAGIKEVICPKPSEDLTSRWGDDILLAKEIFQESGIQLIIVDDYEKCQ